MTLPVFHVPGLGARSAGEEVRLDGPEGRHAVVVRRLGIGEHLVLTDGRGTVATCAIVAVDGPTALVRVESAVNEEPVAPRVTVVQALPKGERGELAVEMLTEVGVDTIVPWAASRSVAQWRGDRGARSLEKWRATAREAAKQSRRSWFPEVTDLADTGAVAAVLAAADLAVVLHEDADEPLAALGVDVALVAVVVGPEGGISADELERFGDAGAHVVRLGSSVLRTSTAGVAAAAALLSRTPRWR